jgi:hypothetical protein
MLVVKSDSSEGVEKYLGKQVTLFGVVYIYTGKLVAIDKTWAKLEEAAIVYETGPFMDKEWKDAQRLPHPVMVRLSSIESLMELK